MQATTPALMTACYAIQLPRQIHSVSPSCWLLTDEHGIDGVMTAADPLPRLLAVRSLALGSVVEQQGSLVLGRQEELVCFCAQSLRRRE